VGLALLFSSLFFSVAFQLTGLAKETLAVVVVDAIARRSPG
jgi:uncharacterized membrane protein